MPLISLRAAGMRAVTGLLVALARIAPRTALRIAASTGRLAHSLAGFGNSASQVARLYGDASPAEVRRYARDLAASELRTMVAEGLMLRAPEVAARIIEIENPEEILRLREGGPKLFVTWHSGPIEAFAIVLDRLGIPAAMFRNRAGGPSLRLVDAITTEDEGSERRALALRRGVAALREGRLVGLAIDGESGAMAPPAPCLGRLVPIRRGAALLARLAGAEIYPATAAWTPRSTILVTLHPRLELDPRSPGFEADFSRAFGVFLEGFLLRHRDALRPGKVRLFSSSPPA